MLQSGRLQLSLFLTAGRIMVFRRQPQPLLLTPSIILLFQKFATQQQIAVFFPIPLPRARSFEPWLILKLHWTASAEL